MEQASNDEAEGSRAEADDDHSRALLSIHNAKTPCSPWHGDFSGDRAKEYPFFPRTRVRVSRPAARGNHIDRTPEIRVEAPVQT